MRGRIVRGVGGFYYVRTAEGAVYECRARGLFRKEGVKPLVGDHVCIEVIDEEQRTGSVAEVLPRSNALIRPEVANVEQALVVYACASPEPNMAQLDRFLITLRAQDVPILLLWNKADLVDAGRRDALMEAYRDAGVGVRCICAKEPHDVEALRRELSGRTSILAGPSGVGKSTLLNALCDASRMATGTVSRKQGRGRHTTRHAEIFQSGEDSYLVDTPGFTALSLYEMPAEEVKAYYPEFYPYEGACRFQPCSHTHEPDCAVRRACEDGAISAVRYASYQELYAQQREAAPRHAR